MGYTVEIESVEFSIPEERAEEAATVLVALGLWRGEPGNMDGGDALLDALEEAGFEAESREGGVAITGYLGTSREEEDVLVALAQYVPTGSFVQWLGQDGHHWRSVVRDGALASQRVCWEDDGMQPVRAPELVTVIPVQYRDAANWKVAAQIQLQGAITASQIESLRAALHEGCYFVPGQIGQSHLGASAWSSFPCDDDHGWHEMDLAGVELRRADELQRIVYCGETEDGGTVADFVERVARIAAAGWDADGRNEHEAE